MTVLWVLAGLAFVVAWYLVEALVTRYRRQRRNELLKTLPR
jgi:hypothetical protein